MTDSLKNVCLKEWREGGNPCVLERWHDEPYHRDAEGYEWRVPLEPQFVPDPTPPETREVQGGWVLAHAHPKPAPKVPSRGSATKV